MADSKLYILPSSKYFNGVVSIIKKEGKKKNTIYVTTNKPYNNLVNLFKKKKVSPEKIFFIDCISKNIGAVNEKAKNCLFLESPEHVTGLSLAIKQAVKLVPGEKMLFFDSISTMLIYNNETVIGKFSNFIINTLRANKVSTILFALASDTDKNVIQTIQSFVDEVINHG